MLALRTVTYCTENEETPSGMPQLEVALRAGLKNVRGLVHLRQHLPDGPRLELARASSRKDDEPLRPTYA